MNVWQIATGETGRDYRDLCFAHDVMIIGHSHKGSAMKYDYSGGKPNSPESQVFNFAHKPKPGDRILMRLAHEVIGIGQIPEGKENQYDLDKQFNCVYGWDLSHCRRVIWADGFELGSLANVFEHSKQKPTFTQVHEKEIIEMVRVIDNAHFDRPLKDKLRLDTTPYTHETLGVALFEAGISNRNIEEILQALQQAERLCNWYRSDKCGRKPTENEIISHIILPLLLGLGWSHQQIAVEWNRVDLALFKMTPTTKDNCIVILEAKGLGRPLGDVLIQPEGYIESLGLTNVVYILTTDGENLFVYGKDDEIWDPKPIGYISVSKRQKAYALPKDVSLVDTLVMLQPSLLSDV